jgi:Ethanolamine utilization protein EutJ (predicted chaperonin)
MNYLKFIGIYAVGLFSVVPINHYFQSFGHYWSVFLTPIASVLIAEILVNRIKEIKRTFICRIGGACTYFMLAGLFPKESTITEEITWMAVIQAPLVLAFVGYHNHRNNKTQPVGAGQRR